MPGTNIYGELIRAQLQNSASDLASAVNGLVYYNTTTPGIRYYNGAWRAVANLDEAQALTNKTIGATNVLTGATAASFANGGGVTISLPTVTGTLASLAPPAQTFAGKVTHNLLGYISESATIFGGILAPASTPPKAVQRITVGEATLGNVTNTEGALVTELVLINATASSISVLNDQGASSSIITGTGGDLTLAAGASIILLYDATSLRWRVVGGSGSGGSSEVVAQTAHGFVVGDALYLNGSVYTKAIATASNTSSVVGVVSRVQSVNIFEFSATGKVTGLSGLTVGADYFLSPTTAGLLTVTEPTTTGHVSQPVGIALSATELQVAIKRGVVIGTSNVFTTITLANTAATTIQNIASFANGEGGVLTGVFRIDATTDYTFGFEISFTKDIAGVINHSVRYFAGDVLPGISVTVSGQNIQVTLGTLAGFVSATARFQLSASAVSPSLQISSDNVTFQEATAFRNRIINGDFNIWQRATSQTSSGYGSMDRWFNEHLGSTKTTSRQTFTLGQTDVPGNPVYFARTVVSSVGGVANYVSKKQSIEGVHNFAGQSVTLSFWAKADASKNIAVEFAQGFGTGGSPSATVNSIGVTTLALTSTWKKFTVNVSIPSISGKTLGTNGDDCLVLNMWFDAGSNYNARTNTLGQQSGTFDISRVQLEQGIVATPFEVRPIGKELDLCKRYYYRLTSATANGTAFRFGNGNNVTANAGQITINLPVSLRATPTSLETTGVPANYSVYAAGATSPCNAALVLDTAGCSPEAVTITAPVAGTLTAGHGCALIANTNNTAFLGFNAEL